MDPVRGVCIGCCRTLDEIARWSGMPEGNDNKSFNSFRKDGVV